MTTQNTIASPYFILEECYTIVETSERLHDAPPVDPTLKQYYDHVCELFQKRLAEFNTNVKPTNQERKRLVSLFNEILRVRAIMIDEDEATWSKLC
jgi:hypothetical protein